MNVSIPKELREWIEGKISSGGYGSVSEYIRELVRRDQRSSVNQHAQDGVDILHLSGQPWRPASEERMKRLRGE